MAAPLIQAASLDDIPVTVIGHPWAPIGMGEQLRSHLAASRAAGLDLRVFDIFRYAQRTDPAHARLVEPIERDDVPPGIRIFHINGDEVDRVVEALEARGNSFAAGYNIVVPAWELPEYPAEWAEKLRRFDEVWALSSFIQSGLAKARITAPLIGQAIEPEYGPLLPRRHFGIRESAFVLLTFFDLSSYASRKNPFAVIELFNRLRAEDPFRDLQLVLKAKNGERGAEEWAATVAADAQIKVIDTPLDTLGVRSLINCCDCFVSLHRSEGFGRGPGEAMALGRLALATDWSGNTDFMTAENALPVRHTKLPLEDGDYPHWQGQSWANPDVEHACTLLRPILDDPSRGAALARVGQASVLRSHGNRAVGLRILARLNAIAAESPKFGATPPAKSRRRK
jgi:glycosyltransferase involved in cell wall biosynthesis